MKKKIKSKSSTHKIFSKIKNSTNVEFYDNDEYSTIEIAWTLKNVGFGHLYLFYDKEKDCFLADTEMMSEELTTKIITLAASKLAKKFLELDLPNSGTK